MTLSDRIASDMKAAMKSGNTLRLETLRTLRAQFIELSKRGIDTVPTPEDELSVLLGAMKKRREAIELYEKAGRKDLSEKEKSELDIILEYLPRQMSREEAKAEIQKIVHSFAEVTTKDFGKIMGLAMKDLKGKIDGKVVQELVKQELGG